MSTGADDAGRTDRVPGRLTAALIDASTRAIGAAGGHVGGVYLRSPTPGVLRLAVLAGLPGALFRPWWRLHADSPFPVADAYRLGVRVVLPNAAETMRRYPQFAAGLPFPFGSLYVPVAGASRAYGVLTVLRPPAPHAADVLEGGPRGRAGAGPGRGPGAAGRRRCRAAGRLGGRAAVRTTAGLGPARAPRRKFRLGPGNRRRHPRRAAVRPARHRVRGRRNTGGARDAHRGAGPRRRSPDRRGAAGHRRGPAAPAAPVRAHRGRFTAPGGAVAATVGAARRAGARRRARPLRRHRGRRRGRPAAGGCPVRRPARHRRVREPPRRPPAGRAAGGAGRPLPVGGRALAGPGRLRGSSARRPALPGAGPLPRPATARRRPPDRAAALRGRLARRQRVSRAGLPDGHAPPGQPGGRRVGRPHARARGAGRRRGRRGPRARRG